MKILITDILLRKSFDIHNIIRARHRDWTAVLLLDNPSLWARLKCWLFYGSPVFTLRKSSYEDFETDLLSVLKRFEESELVYLPVEEDTTLLFYRFLTRHNIPNLHFNLPPLRSFQTVRDKKKLVAFCRQEGFSVPEEFASDRLKELASNFRPVVIKPKIGSGAGGIRFIEKRKQLKQLDSIDLDNSIVQEKIGDMNEIQGGFFLYDRGQLLAHYSHLRIRTYPPRGGVSVYSKITRNPRLKAAGERVLEKLGWSGLAMIEFMFDRRTGEHKIIEVNPRLWGSIILSEFSGTAFLEQYVHSCLGALPQAKPAVRTDVFIRWFFPFDLFNYCLSFFRIKNFWRMNPATTCYINWTYAPRVRRIIYMLFLDFHFLIELTKRLIGK